MTLRKLLLTSALSVSKDISVYNTITEKVGELNAILAISEYFYI
jgi:hypothetical protein